jgi:hypothetical protein
MKRLKNKFLKELIQ